MHAELYNMYVTTRRDTRPQFVLSFGCYLSTDIAVPHTRVEPY